MGRELRIVGFVVLAAIAFSLLGTYNKQPAKPMSMPLPIADESKPEPPRTVRVIQIYQTPSDKVPADTTPVEPISAFPETTTMALSETLPSSLSTPPPAPPPQKSVADFCERFHLHKVFTNNGKSWRCRK
jgi:hypothetical protein